MTRFLGMASFGIPFGAIIHKVVEIVEGLLGYTDTKILAPASNYRVHLLDERHGGRPQVFTPDPFEFLPYLVDRLRTRFDQQLVTTARAVRRRVLSNVEAQEIEAFGKMTNTGFVFREP